MGQFTTIPSQTFKEIQTNAGVLLKKFTPASPTIKDDDIICATTGGINAACVPTYSDWFEDVDNAPNNTKEGQHLDGWDCTMSFTAVNVTEEIIKLSLGAADITTASKLVKPRNELKDEDFSDIWWVGDRSDGGLVAICLKNALATGGFSLKTAKNGKGNISVSLKGFVSTSTPTDVPMEFYVASAT